MQCLVELSYLLRLRLGLILTEPRLEFCLITHPLLRYNCRSPKFSPKFLFLNFVFLIILPILTILCILLHSVLGKF
jgi:hypothetical protein